jgi:ferredoxin
LEIIDINTRLAVHPDRFPISRSQAPLPDHETWSKIVNNPAFLKLAPAP